MITDDVIGKSIECAHDDNNNITTTIDSLTIAMKGKNIFHRLVTNHVVFKCG